MRAFVALAAVCAMGLPTLAQSTLDWPVGEYRPLSTDTGLLENPNDDEAVVFEHVLEIKDAAWLRVYFGKTALDEGSYVRITSFLDGEVQELDAAGLAMWRNSSAYFNGSAVLIELIAGPMTTGNRLTLREVALEIDPVTNRGGSGQCGICGGDGRVPSADNWTGRLLPFGCTATVWNAESCLVSAGHCISGNDTIQFNVPNSNGNCSVNHPPIADQFPTISETFTNGGPGNDWAVMTTGTNNLGETAFDRYGLLRPIAASPAFAGQNAELTGYGVDLTCTRSQTQQFANGPISQVFSNAYTFSIDLRGGNSGSALMRNSAIIGIATHCPCPNVATRIDLAAFASARAALCAAACNPPNCDDNDACTDDVCGGGGCVHDYKARPFGDIVSLFAWEPGAPPQPDLDDLLCVLDGFGAGPLWPSVCPGGDLWDSVNAQCGLDGQLNLDDIIAEVDAFGGVPACPAPCP